MANEEKYDRKLMAHDMLGKQKEAKAHLAKKAKSEALKKKKGGHKEHEEQRRLLREGLEKIK